jgi:hypothetical protein
MWTVGYKSLFQVYKMQSQAQDDAAYTKRNPVELQQHQDFGYAQRIMQSLCSALFLLPGFRFLNIPSAFQG